MIDAVIAAIVVGLVGFFFFVFLMLRRTAAGFREGVESGQNRRRK